MLGCLWGIGIANTAIGGQRIEEYMTNASVLECKWRTGSNGATGIDTPGAESWDAVLYAKQVVPFVDMTVKGFAWYENDFPLELAYFYLFSFGNSARSRIRPQGLCCDLPSSARGLES